MIAGFSIIEKEIKESIISELNKIGLLYRIFSRSKDDRSIFEKTERKKNEGCPYDASGKLIQDIIGIRVVTYFKDDVPLVRELLRKTLTFIDEEIDEEEPTIFKPKRTNIICRFNEKHTNTLSEIKLSSSNTHMHLLDSTFELQLRTILSEGWHEIDHSLRYKCKSDWKGHTDSERLLNGIYASLETSDVALRNLFNDLSYKHFKNSNWEGLIRNKLRIQFQLGELKQNLSEIMDEDKSIGKSIHKLDRHEVLLALHALERPFPVNLNNILFQLNCMYLKNDKITNLTPSVIKDSFEITF